MRFAVFMLAAFLTAATPEPSVGPDLAKARTFATKQGDKLWRGYGSAPFGFLLVAPDRETLLCESRLPAGFTPGPRDPGTGCTTATRARSWVKETFLAAMPLFGPPSTIVMGTPHGSGRSRPDWIRTILHEHFHQWQSALPDYYPRTTALGLANGDQSGMWMLNYPFPYDKPAVVAAHAAAANALADALAARGTKRFGAALRRYMIARQAFETSVSPADWRYVELQLWQEGVARWSEIALGKLYPDSAVRASAVALERETIFALRVPELARSQRLFAYPYGAGEAMLLDTCGPQWREAYRTVLALGPLLRTAAKRCTKRSVPRRDAIATHFGAD